MQIDEHTGLVLEGGGMRGVFTTGVLDYFLDRQLYFHYAIGVSAGACNGLSYMSRQRGRARATNIDLLEKHRYIGMKYLWTQRSILDREFLYEKLPRDILPYDYQTYFRNPATFEMVTVNCMTGQPCYLTEKHSEERTLTIAKASSSLPFVCPIVMVDGIPMLDGGIVDSIPVQRAVTTGHAFNVVVLTRNAGYRSSGRDRKIPKFIYKTYPRLRVALSHRHACYNRQLEQIGQMEQKGQILVIRPERPMEVGRLENDTRKLNDLYEEGYACAEKALHNVSILI